MEFVSSTTAVVVAEDNIGVPGCPEAPQGSFRTTVLLGRYAWRDHSVDTLGVFPGVDRTGPEHRVYGRDFVVTAESGTILAGETGGDSIHVFSTSGDPVPSMPLPLRAQPITSRAKSMSAPRPRMNEDGSLRRFPPYDYPEAYPVFARLLADTDGNVWVMKYPELTEPTSSAALSRHISATTPPGGAEWLVLNRDGHTIAEASMPLGVYALEIGSDYVLGLSRDSLDVESIRLHRLSR